MARHVGLKAHAELVSLVCLTALCLLAWWPALASGFRYDDAQHLQFAAAHAPWQYFSQREVMLQLSYAHIAPWNALFFDLGLPWFGLDARGHHAHLLLVMWMAALSTWRLLRRWLDEPAAALGAALFVAMPPSGVVAHLLMTGHYAWGLLFSVWALHAFCRAVEERSWQLTLLAAGALAMACLCKEPYVLLPLAWAALPLGSWRQRFKAMLPSLFVLVGYAWLRFHVVGGVGGYAAITSDAVAISETVGRALRRAAASLGPLLFGQGPVGWLATGLAVALVALAFRQGRRLSMCLCCTAAAVLMAPVLPLFSFDLGAGYDRVMLLPAWGVAVGLAWLCRAVRWPLLIGLALIPPLAVGQRHAVQAVLAPQQIMAAQNAFMVSAPAGAVLVPDGYADVGALRLMADAVQTVEQREPPRLIDDEEELARLGPELGPLSTAWSPDCACMQALGANYARRVKAAADAVELGRGRTLSGSLGLSDHGRHKKLAWSVNTAGGAAYLHVRGFNRLALPPKGQLAFGIDNGARLGARAQVRWVLKSDDGALTLSDWRDLPMTGSHRVTWP